MSMDELEDVIEVETYPAMYVGPMASVLIDGKNFPNDEIVEVEFELAVRLAMESTFEVEGIEIIENEPSEESADEDENIDLTDNDDGNSVEGDDE